MHVDCYVQTAGLTTLLNTFTSTCCDRNADHSQDRYRRHGDISDTKRNLFVFLACLEVKTTPIAFCVRLA